MFYKVLLPGTHRGIAYGLKNALNWLAMGDDLSRPTRN